MLMWSAAIVYLALLAVWLVLERRRPVELTRLQVLRKLKIK